MPISIAGDTISLAGKEYSAEGVAVLAALPHPASEGNYIAVHAGTSPEAITAGSHLDMMLLPDYVVYAGAEMLDWGFWDSDWR